MSKPLVSVITTAYNCDKFIEESMRSIFGQSFKDFEIIVFNDSSEDMTWDVIDSTIRCCRVNYSTINRIVGFGNVGVGPGREIALDRASGKYIAIQDGDDISHKDRLLKQVEFLESNKDVFCVGSWAEKVDEEGNYIEDMKYPPLTHNDCVDAIFSKLNPIIDPSAMFRRDVFDKIGGYETSWDLVPDLHLWIKAMLGGYRFANIPEKLVSYRRHKNSVTGIHKRETISQHSALHKDVLSKQKKRVFKDSR